MLLHSYEQSDDQAEYTPSLHSFEHPAVLYNSPVAGDADLLVVPDIVSGNIAAKTITVIGGGRTGGVVLGAKVPVLLVSRAASADDKYMSIVIAALVGGK